MTAFLLLICVLCSHGAAAVPFVRSIRKRRLPSTVEFAVLSFFLYYDLGILSEALGLPYRSLYFLPLSKARDWVQLQAAIIIVVAPWLIRLGYSLTGGTPTSAGTRPLLARKLSKRFYFVSFLILLPVAALSLFEGMKAEHVWEARALITEALGPFIILLLLPIYLLAFYVTTEESRKGAGKLFILVLTALSVVAVIPSGERTLLLLPFLILLLFYGKLSVGRLATSLVIGLVAAAMLLPIYKAQNADETDAGTLIANTISVDFVRGPILVDVLKRSPMLGTNVVSYPGEGYVYGLLFFVPRSIAPFKGSGTAFYYTGAVANVPASELDWGLGISAIDEIILNFGKLFIIPGLLVWGAVMRLADFLSVRRPFLVIPTRLGAVWLLGYHLPAELQNFGAMAAVGLLLEWVFVHRGQKRIFTASLGYVEDPMRWRES
ncbi:MAG TPA: hypothetical protein VFP59_16240 [Candidatus Angelobacter sp.]|nr:hypothetical protein [Candidatus Angelobacter sp.]